MKVISLLLQNRLLTAAVCSWLCAQILKMIIYSIMNRTLDIHRLLGDGGMPSGHSATVTALAVTAALQCGVESPAFAISTIFAIVVMHDAMGVRREAGKHAKALNEIFAMLEGPVEPEEMMKEFLGHTPLQVFFGAVLGFCVALIF